MMQGDYSGTFEYPVIPGSEGSGTVIASGGGWMAWMLMGKRVGFTRQSEKGGKFSKGGSYGEYMVTNAFQCVTLANEVTWEQGAGSFVNPITAIGLMDKCKEYGAKAAIQTGAASQLGRMIIKVFKENGIELINVVRRQEQVELLKNEYKCEYVLNSTAEGFDAELKGLCEKLGANVVLEACSGDMPGRCLTALGRKAICITYGSLSESKIGPINPAVMIFKAQRIEGFLLPYWLATKSMWGQWSAVSASKRLVTETQMSKCFGLHQVEEAIAYYKANMTQGKCYLKPSLTE
jgi:NADPH2:quinone reductase